LAEMTGSLAGTGTHRGSGTRTVGQWAAFLSLNIWFYTVGFIFSLIWVSLAGLWVLLCLAVTRNRRKTQYVIRRAISWYGSVIIRLPWPWARFTFVDYEPDAKPPFVIVANHRSSSDAYMGAVLPLECVQVLNIWPNHVPFLRFMARIATYLSVREMPFEEFAARGSKLLQEGCSVIAFPEGTRSGSAKLNAFHGASFRLAQMNHVKIMPLAIFGNERIPARGAPWLNPGKVTVSKLVSVKPQEYEGMSAYKLKNLVRERISAHLEAQARESTGA
jgi:1-acyl-sn-glycerol-3-phosphate acyltransferase